MEKNQDYYVVAKEVLPEVFLKVAEAKKLLDNGTCKTASAAAETVGISRSAFYKYKDSILPLHESMRGKTVTIAMNLIHLQGLLSRVLNVISESNANILTINQTIPINGVCNVTITVEAEDIHFYHQISSIEGVMALKIIAKE